MAIFKEIIIKYFLLIIIIIAENKLTYLGIKSIISLNFNNLK